MRWSRWILVITLSVVTAPAVDAQAVGPDLEGATTTILAIAELEQSLLDRERERFEMLVRQRREAMARIESLHQSLDAAVRDQEEPDFRRIDLLIEQLQRVHADRQALLVAERSTVERIADHLERLELLGQQLDTLRAERDEQEQGILTGTWDLVLMPAQQRGSCELRQSGAVVTGTYQLEGGWTGSLQGTLVNRKVFLVRIDSRLGKSMELEGFLSSDGKRVRGTWLNYELAGSEGATGQWSAQRRTEQP